MLKELIVISAIGADVIYKCGCRSNVVYSLTGARDYRLVFDSMRCGEGHNCTPKLLIQPCCDECPGVGLESRKVRPFDEPQFEVLSEDDLDRAHETALQVLAEISAHETAKENLRECR